MSKGGDCWKYGVIDGIGKTCQLKRIDDGVVMFGKGKEW